jgi:transposase InsO family protein
VEVLPDERGETASGFLRRAVAWLAERGVAVERVMTDNGSPYVSTVHAATCRELGIRHLRTRPYRPQTNGKAERFIQTMLREWAYGRLYGSSAERRSQLTAWLDRYNYHRKHGSLGHRPPAARLNELQGNNLLGNYS